MAFRLSITNSSLKINLRSMAVFLAGVLSGLAIDLALDSLGWPVNFSLGTYALILFCFFILSGLVVEFRRGLEGSEKTSEEAHSEEHARNVRCTLKISGDPEKVRKTFDSIFDISNGNLTFERVCPTPKGCTSSVERAMWRLKNWGCTGVQLDNDYPIKATSDIVLPINQIKLMSGSNSVKIKFTTYEGSPIILLRKLADNNPGLKFELTTMI